MQYLLNRLRTEFKRHKFRAVLFYFITIALLATGCLIWLGFIPKDAKNAVVFGYSPFRLLMLLILLLISVTSFFIAIKYKRSIGFQEWFLKTIQQHKLISTAGLTSLLVFFGCTTFILFTPLYKGGLYIAYYQRLLPLAVWGLGFSVITAILLRLFFEKHRKTSPLKWVRIALLIFLIILFLWVFIVISQMGITRDPAYWDDDRPVPILEGQLWAFWWISVTAVLSSLFVENRTHVQNKQIKDRYSRWMDIALFVLIWFAAFVIWIQQPIPNCYFTPRLRPPNYEVYPYSDAGLYDTNSQSTLLGEMDANAQIIKRPLFAMFLAGAHSLVGQDYTRIIFFQTMVLAFIPAVLYLIGKEIGARWTGILLAGYAILMEWNTLKVASLTTTSNSKLLMTELPTTLLMACLVLILIILIKRPEEKRHLTLVMGGLLGMNILLRSQTLLLLPFIFAFFFLVLFRKWKVLLRASLLFILGVALLISPWLIRNWQITGKIAFEDPKYTQVVIQLYESNQPHGTSSIIGNTEGDETGDFFGSAIDFILQNPVQYAGFVLNNFLHNEILSVFILPVRSIKMEGLLQLVNPQDLFWIKPENQLGSSQILLIAFYLGLISIGIAQSFSRFYMAGLAPLLMHLAYNLSSGLSRISGWRFLLPMQWVVFFYFAVGLFQLIIWFCNYFCFFPATIDDLHLFYNNTSRLEQKAEIQPHKRMIIVWGVLFSLLGLAMVAIPQLIPKPYVKQDRQQLIQDIFHATAWVEIPELKNEIEALLQEDDLVLEKGKAFYPKFYTVLDGEPSRNETIYNYRNYPRLIFIFIGKERREIMVPMEVSPAYFPNASEVILVGREKEGTFEVVLVTLMTESPVLYFANLTMQ